MIAKRVPKKTGVADNFTRLGRYVAAAAEEGEKLDRFWLVNCDAGSGFEDLDAALIEIDAVRTSKPGVKDATYHLVVSFRPGDEEKLTGEALRDMEQSFAAALGFGDHHRVAATHVNTDHYHMHVAICRINPHTMRLHTPYNDYRTLEGVARAMERKYGLEADRGMSDVAGPRKSQTAARYEARTWEKSFESHMLGQKAAVLAVVAAARSWKSLHRSLASQGLALKKRGNGLVFVDASSGKMAMKASLLDRSCSLKNLEKRLGAFQAAGPEIKGKGGALSYRPAPLDGHPAIGVLWLRYQRRLKRQLGIGGSWKDWLLGELPKDPLALATIMIYRQWARLLFGEGRKPLPRTLRPGVKKMLAAKPRKQPLKPEPLPTGLLIDGGDVLIPFADQAGVPWAFRAVDAAGRSCEIGDVERAGLRHEVEPGRFVNPVLPVFLAVDHDEAARLRAAAPAARIVLAAGEQGLPALIDDLRRETPGAPAPLILLTDEPSFAVQKTARDMGVPIVALRSLPATANPGSSPPTSAASSESRILPNLSQDWTTMRRIPSLIMRVGQETALNNLPLSTSPACMR